MLDKLNLPPNLKENAHRAWARVGPWLAQAGKATEKLLTAGRLPTLGETFSHLCIVGLNKSELLLAGEKTPVFSENWQDLADDNLRRGLALMFFAPRTLEGTPVNPHLFLMGEGKNDADANAEGSLAMAEQALQGMGLLDFCRMTPSDPNRLNMVLAADVLFHWDVHDNYVLPTTNLSWVRDVEQVLKGYPRTTKAVIYTSWETDLMPPSERITILPLRELPIDEAVWLNKPTFQDKYGSHVLAIALLVATGMWFMLHSQQQSIDAVNEELRMVEQQIPNQGRMGDLSKAVSEQEKFLQRRELFYLSVKDTARAITTSQVKFVNFEVKQADPQTTPKEYIATIEAEKGAYTGWLQEEPIAKDVLMASALMTAIRKPPANTFKLEGLIPLELVWKDYKRLSKSAVPKAAPQATEKALNAQTEVQP